jgi:hypothetical protein
VSSVVVVDASLAMKWLVRDVHSDKAYALACSRARQKVYPMAPYLISVEVANALHAQDRLSLSYARKLRAEPSLFPEDNILAQPYHYDVHFHNQLKARLLEHNTPTQIIRESTIAHHEFLDRFGNPTRKLGNSQSAIAWNLSTATF